MIYFTLDEKGKALADVEIEGYIISAISQIELHPWSRVDIHVANQSALLYARLYLKKIPVSKRPMVNWMIYGQEVKFDKNLNTEDKLDERLSLDYHWAMALVMTEVVQ